MRAANIIGFVIIGIAVIVMAPAITTGQPGGFGKGKTKGQPGGAFPGGGGGTQDPNAMFDYLAKDRQFFLISETTRSNATLTAFAQERGIAGGKITRQQYQEYSDWMAKKRAAGANPGGGQPGVISLNPGGGGFDFGKKKGFDKGGLPPVNPQASPDQIDALAEAEFKKADSNSDGRLNQEEMPRPLRFSLVKFDTNADNLIDLQEFKLYFNARMQGNDNSGNGGGVASIIIQDADLDAKPVVFRAGGKMPTGLPRWFMELDTDHDGQVAPYEWRRANKSMDEFANWDLNGDMFITPDEALHQQTALAKTSKSQGSMAGFGGGDEGDGPRPFSFGKKGEGGGYGPFGGGKDGGKKGFGGFGGGEGGERPSIGGMFGKKGGDSSSEPKKGSSKKKGGN